MVQIASAFFELKDGVIENIKLSHPNDVPAQSKEMIAAWRNKNPENQVKVWNCMTHCKNDNVFFIQLLQIFLLDSNVLPISSDSSVSLIYLHLTEVGRYIVSCG